MSTGQDAKVLHSPTTRATNAQDARRPIQTSKPPKDKR